MEDRDMEHQIEIPQEWHPKDDYSSHRPLLYLAIKNTKYSIVELGCGKGSTRLLYDFFTKSDHIDVFFSLETNPEYASQFECTNLVESYFDTNGFKPCGLLFIDCAPGEIRKDLIELYANDADIIVIHDTEPGAEYVYGLSPVLSLFKYRLDLHIPGMPSTTAVSNFVDINQWKGEYSGFKFI